MFGAEFDADALVGEDRLTRRRVESPPVPDAAGAVPLLDEVTAALGRGTSHEEQVRLGARAVPADASTPSTRRRSARRCRPIR